MKEVMPDAPSDHSISRHDIYHSQYELPYIVWAISRTRRLLPSARNIPNFRCIAVGSAAHRKTSKDTEKDPHKETTLFGARHRNSRKIREKPCRLCPTGVKSCTFEPVQTGCGKCRTFSDFSELVRGFRPPDFSVFRREDTEKSVQLFAHAFWCQSGFNRKCGVFVSEAKHVF